YNHCVRVITPDGVIDTFAGTCGEAHVGLPGVPSMADERVATDAKLQKPFGVAIDPSTGDVYIADTYNHVFRVVYE
ncbi:MAG: phospholipase, partial [Deltaproteobacteria bacterium]|nr:phospholipase [Deltaproteobacteria bacterium]